MSKQIGPISGEIGRSEGALKKPAFFDAYDAFWKALVDANDVGFRLDMCSKAISEGATQIIDDLHTIETTCTTMLDILSKVTPIGVVGSIAIDMLPETLEAVENIGSGTKVNWAGLTAKLALEMIFAKFGPKLEEKIEKSLSGNVLKAVQKAGISEEAAKEAIEEIKKKAPDELKSILEKISEKVFSEHEGKETSWGDFAGEVFDDAIKDWEKEQIADILKGK
jgi:hypothetical protein